MRCSGPSAETGSADDARTGWRFHTPQDPARLWLRNSLIRAGSAPRSWRSCWRTPMLLRQRLGHLDAAHIAGRESAVRDVVQAEPKLHRYVEKMPRGLVLAAWRVMNEYDGDAGAIWADQPSADDLQRRFDEFNGPARRRLPWRWRSWREILALRSGTWGAATSRTTFTCGASSCKPGSLTATTVIT